MDELEIDFDDGPIDLDFVGLVDFEQQCCASRYVARPNWDQFIRGIDPPKLMQRCESGADVYVNARWDPPHIRIALCFACAEAFLSSSEDE